MFGHYFIMAFFISLFQCPKDNFFYVVNFINFFLQKLFSRIVILTFNGIHINLEFYLHSITQ